MKKLLLILFLVINFDIANATEVLLPSNLGKINITNNVVTIPQGMQIPNGDYKVIVDGNEVIVSFNNNVGVIK